MRSWCALLLLSSIAVAQAQAPAGQKPTAKPSAPAAQSAPQAQAPAKPAAPAANPAAVPENAPVVTLNGVCAEKSAKPADCKTQITRAQFEQILNAVTTAQPGSAAQLSPSAKRNLATQYSQLLAVATKAENEGIQNTPEAQQLLKFARMQALAQAYTRDLQKKLEPTPAEIQSYYDANSAKFEQATLERIFVPKNPGEEKGKPADEAAQKAKADKLRARAAAGESFDTLQKEAIEGTKFPAPPETKTVVQRGTLPPTQEAVFNLKQGEVSQVFDEPAGYYIYKMVSEEKIPLDKLKSQISQHLLQEKMRTAVESLLKSAQPVLDEQYFGPPAQLENLPGAGEEETPAPKPPAGAPEKPAGESKPK